MRTIIILSQIFFLSTSLFGRPRGVFLDDELRFAKFVGTVVIDRYDNQGTVYFHSIEYSDTITKALGQFYGEDGFTFPNPDKNDLTACSPFKKDTVLIVINSSNRVSLFARLQADKYRFWSPYMTGSIALFRFSSPAEILNSDKEVKNLNRTNKDQTYFACWDGCFLRKEYLKMYTDKKGERPT